MTRTRLLTGLLLLSVALPHGVHAQGIVDPPTDSPCLQELYRAFGREHRMSRAVLFGKTSAADAPLTAVHYDGEGNAWIKTGDDEWKSPAAGFDNTTWTNAQMDRQGEKDLLCTGNEDAIERSCVRFPRRGIVETRKTPTTDLVQPIVQTIRALQCRLRAVCEVAAESQGKTAGETIDVEHDGCLPMSFPVMRGCIEVESTIFNTLPDNCAAARRQLIAREMHLLTLTVSYDAGYRSLAQFAGIFQEFLVQFRFPLIEPLWQMIRTVGGLNGIPCFQAECNE